MTEDPVSSDLASGDPVGGDLVTNEPSLFGTADATRAGGRGGLETGTDEAEGLPTTAPLAARMRPRSLEELVGQEHLTAPGTALRSALERRSCPSLILWGPPGSGKTTLARLVARELGARFVVVPAVSSGVADLRRAIDQARRLATAGRRTVLFIDEIHRFNKAQQDALLPHVERGDVILIGATTENPSFEVNAALLSRTRVFVLRLLDEAALGTIVDRALSDPQRGLGGRIRLEPDARVRLVRLAGGDARNALNALELAVEIAAARGEGTLVRRADVDEAMQRRTLRYDRAGDEHYDVISAYIKSLRDSDPDGAVYWLARLLEAGEDPLFAARRLVIAAAEDVGLADPQALVVAMAAYNAAHAVGMPEAVLPLTEATIYVALAPKSNSALRAYGAAAAAVHETGALPVPLHLRNAVTALMRGLGYGAGYQYAHDMPDARVEQEHLPEGWEGRKFYEPGSRGWEADSGR
jgi:putative ATPase